MNFNFSIVLTTIIAAAGLVVDAQEARPKLRSGEHKLMVSEAHTLEAQRKHDPLVDSQSMEVDVSFPWPFSPWCDEDGERCGADVTDMGSGLLDQGCYDKDYSPVNEFKVYNDNGNDCCDSDKFMGSPIPEAHQTEYFCISCWPDGALCGYDGWVGNTGCYAESEWGLFGTGSGSWGGCCSGTIVRMPENDGGGITGAHAYKCADMPDEQGMQGEQLKIDTPINE